MELARAIDAVEQGLLKANEEIEFPEEAPRTFKKGPKIELEDDAEEDWSSKEEFIEYLENTLIPDLQDSGSMATAEDFATAVRFMKGA